MNKIEWVSEKEQEDELARRIVNWKDGLSKDGYVLAGEGTFVYRGIRYIIRILRYYNHTDKFVPIHSKRISDKHVVVEYQEETKSLVEIVKEIEEYSSEFLYHDTLHEHNDKQSLEEQIEEAHQLAKDDIDSLFNGKFMKKLDDRIKRLKELKLKLKRIGDKK